MKRELLLQIRQVTETLYDKKASTIIGIDVEGVSTITDAFLIAQGNVDRHVVALARAVIEAQKERGQYPLHIEGLREGGWIVIDYGDLIVHLFHPEEREKYQFESLWKEGKIIDVGKPKEEKK